MDAAVELGGEPSESLVGGGPVAEDEAIGPPLDAASRRLEGDGDDRGGHQRQHRVWAGGDAEQAADADDHGDVAGGDDARHRPDDEGLVDHRVDVVEPVLDDRDAGGEGHDRDHQDTECSGPEGDETDDHGHGGGDHGVREPAQLARLVAVSVAEAHDDTGHPGDLEQQIAGCAGDVPQLLRRVEPPDVQRMGQREVVVGVLHRPQRRGHRQQRPRSHHRRDHHPPPR